MTQEQFQNEQELYFQTNSVQTHQLQKSDLDYVQNIDTQQLLQNISQIVEQNYQIYNNYNIQLKSAFTSEQLMKILSVAKAFLQKKQNLQQVDIENISDDIDKDTLYPDTFLYINKKNTRHQSDKISQYTNQKQTNHLLTIVGDTHGTWESIQYVFTHFNSKYYVFNGDYVDRGQNSVEVFTFLLIKMLQNPNKVIILRGNHEIASTCSNYSFLAELYMKFDTDCQKLFNEYQQIMNLLPIACRINNQIFICHGGPNATMYLTEVFSSLNRVREPDISQQDPLNDILWSDISGDINVFESVENQARGSGKVIGRNGIQRFLRINKSKILVRSHECVQDGYQPIIDNTAYTLFSVSRYNQQNNKGAVMHVEYDKNKQYSLIIDQFLLNQQASIDCSIFQSDDLCRRFSYINSRELKQFKQNQNQLKLFYSYFTMGYIQYDYSVPPQIKYLFDKEGNKYQLKSRYSAYKNCSDVLIEEIQQVIDEKLDDPQSRPYACQLDNMSKSLGEFGIQLPNWLFCGTERLDKKDIEKIIKKSDKETENFVQKKLQKRREILKKKLKKQK